MLDCLYSLFLIPDCANLERPKAVILPRPDWPQIFSGETVTFRCDIPGELPSEWRYRWRKDGQKVKPDGVGEMNIYRITAAEQTHSGKYTCTGLRKSDYKFSQASESVTLTVAGEFSIFADVIFAMFLVCA